jgi:hypothetical protein
MKAMMPKNGGADSYRAGLDLAAYERAAENHNLNYDMAFQQAQQGLALSGLQGMAKQSQGPLTRFERVANALSGLFR